MRVLGIDPALAGPLGYGVVETDGRSYRSLVHGAVKAARTLRASPGNAAPVERLRQIHRTIAGLLDQHAPDAVAVESVFTALNKKTALKLAEVRGVVMLAAAERGIPVHSYSPREVKSAVAGSGNADKQQMQHMVRVLLGMRAAAAPVELGSDAADALAVALCHIYSAEAQARLAAATAPRTAAAPARVNGRRGSRIQSSR